MFSDRKDMKLEINSWRKARKFTNVWKLNTLEQPVSQRKTLKDQLKTILRQKKIETQQTITYGMQQKQFCEGSL